jgi:hypothetical protein
MADQGVVGGVAAPEASKGLTMALASLRHTFTVCDPTLPDCPIVYASDGFSEDDRLRRLRGVK